MTTIVKNLNKLEAIFVENGFKAKQAEQAIEVLSEVFVSTDDNGNTLVRVSDVTTMKSALVSEISEVKFEISEVRSEIKLLRWIGLTVGGAIVLQIVLNLMGII